ncbi:MAG: peptide-methionine (S)-S-oxide reductase MsrA [Bacteroidota bacterium]
MKYLSIIVAALMLFACNTNKNGNASMEKEGKPAMVAQEAELDYSELSIATFAGGCFWCTEAVFERTKGVKDVVSGYTGGQTKNPTYQTIGTGRTGHAEAVEIYYDSTIITYPKLVEIFFVAHDPTQLNRQGPDVGTQYRSDIFYRNEAEKAIIEEHIQYLTEQEKFPRKIVTKITPFEKFYIAEDYHQDYYELHPENPYIQNVSRPKVEKFLKVYKEDWVKEKYKGDGKMKAAN